MNNLLRNRPNRLAIDRTEIAFLVCESGRRWLDTARRFVGPFQHADPSIASTNTDAGDPSSNQSNNGPVVIVKSSPLERVRASLAGESSGAILWELSVENAKQLSLTIAQISSSRPNVLQIVALHQGAVVKGAALGIQMMEFGVRAVVASPEEFAKFTPLVHRHFANEASHDD